MQNQENILYTMKNLIDSIRNFRNINKIEHTKHKEIFTKIDYFYNKLNADYQNEFNNYSQ